MDNYNYPMGADTPDAPWNQVDLPEKEIEVTISLTLSKTVKIFVDDYIIEEEFDDGHYYKSCNFSECDLHEAVKNQIVLPNEISEYIEKVVKVQENIKTSKPLNLPPRIKNAIEDCKDWCVDDFEVILE